MCLHEGRRASKGESEACIACYDFLATSPCHFFLGIGSRSPDNATVMLFATFNSVSQQGIPPPPPKPRQTTTSVGSSHLTTTMPYLVIGGDVGGTNSRLALYELQEKDLQLKDGKK